MWRAICEESWAGFLGGGIPTNGSLRGGEVKAVQWRWCRQVRGTFEGWEEGVPGQRFGEDGCLKDYEDSRARLLGNLGQASCWGD